MVVPYLYVDDCQQVILFYAGALVAHFRARVFYNIAFPGVYLLLAVVATGYWAQRLGAA